jgi:hypothetical protein
VAHIIAEYYQGVVQNLRSEVDSINNLFHHQGIKGASNESLLRDLLKKFIPKQYGVGTGVVIDRNGEQSRQCDIIIYDTLLYPALLSLTDMHFFPIDIVHAVIEVKTTLTSHSVQEAITNIASVRALDYIPITFMSSEAGSDTFGAYKTSPPLGFVFAYNSNVIQFETFRKWFLPPRGKNIPTSMYPSLVGCLDQGLLFWKKDDIMSTYPEFGMQMKGWMVPLLNDNDRPITLHTSQETFTYEKHLYPVKCLDENYIVVDQGRVLLLFLLFLQEMLSRKKISPTISFLATYFDSQPVDIAYEI